MNAPRSVLLVSLGILALLPGCDTKAEKSSAKHEHKAPHAGTLAEFGGDFGHFEVVLDSASGRLTCYVLDGEAENPVRVAEQSISLRIKSGGSSFTLRMEAVGNKLTGETAGDTSQFEGQSDGLRGLKEFDAVIENFVFKGKTFSGVAFNFPKGNEHD
jgi:hypothetical protein